MKYNKLVRDKIPENIKKKGERVISHIATEKEYWQKLKEKLSEEIEEFKKNESIEEFADFLEVADAIAEYKKFSKEDIESIRKAKAREKGLYKKRVILDES